MQRNVPWRNQALIYRSRGLIGGVMVVAIGIAGISLWRSQSSPVAISPAAPIKEEPIRTVTALGRLAPKGEVIKLAAPTSSQGNRVERLLVEEGDRVQAGQVVAILDSFDRLQAALLEAEQEVQVAQAQLAIIKAGAKQGEIGAQRAEIDRLEAEQLGEIDTQKATVERLKAELANAQAEFDRYQSLYREGAISASQNDSKRLALDTAQSRLKEALATLDRLRSTRPSELNRAKATLSQISEVRSVDVRAAQAAVERVIALRHQAKVNLDQASVRSPIAGEVLFIHTRSGEAVGSEGIVEIGQTKQMQAIAEVYQSDVGKVSLGQRVRVTSEALNSELTGVVERIGSQVRRQTIVNTDPSTNIDARVVEVHVTLDDRSSQIAAKLTNLQVTVVIER